MPIIDSKRGVLVLRIAYDGPPMSGKTTSIRALAAGLGVKVTTPDELGGRTLFFDWMDYVGGLYEGRQIRCQVVSVPGQRQLAARRQKLLQSADVVVLVADTRRKQLPQSVALAESLVSHCRAQSPPVSFFVQANKRDAQDALSIEAVQAAFAPLGAPSIVETVATEGGRIREAFVFAVRLGLDRVRACAEAGTLETTNPQHEAAEDLMADLKSIAPLPVQPRTQDPLAEAGRPEPIEADAEAGGAEPVATESSAGRVEPIEADAEAGHVEPVAADAAGSQAGPVTPRTEASPGPSPTGAQPSSPRISATPRSPMSPRRVRDSAVGVTLGESDEAPFQPDPNIPSGFVWPPVEGRAMLREVHPLQLQPVLAISGEWTARGPGFELHSPAHARFDGPERGRAELVEWARVHATHTHMLSGGRTIVLSDAGQGRLRLWQLVRISETLRERIATVLTHADPVEAARGLTSCARHLLVARDEVHCRSLPVPCTLWTISGDVRVSPRYMALMPHGDVDDHWTELDGIELLRREFGPILSHLDRQRDDVQAVVNALTWSAQTSGAEQAADMLARLVSDMG